MKNFVKFEIAGINASIVSQNCFFESASNKVHIEVALKGNSNIPGDIALFKVPDNYAPTEGHTCPLWLQYTGATGWLSPSGNFMQYTSSTRTSAYVCTEYTLY